MERLAFLLLELLYLVFTGKTKAGVEAPYSEDSRTVLQLPVASQARRLSASISGAECDSAGENYSKVYSVRS
jgi:hypothetical protein